MKLKIKRSNKCAFIQQVLSWVDSPVTCLLNVLPTRVLYEEVPYDQDVHAHAMPVPPCLPYLAGICCLLGLGVR
jgi:hypothetical protein